MEQKAINELSDQLKWLIEGSKSADLREVVHQHHPADIAEAARKLNFEDKAFLIKILNNEVSASLLLELDEEERQEILATFTPKEIAFEVINFIDSDDAADLIAGLPESEKQEVIVQIETESSDLAHDIVDLLKHSDHTAGGLMGKEFVSVNQNWNVITCVREMRKQAEGLDEVYSVYVVNDQGKLLGTLALKKLLTSSTHARIEELFRKEINFVKVTDSLEDVANFFQRYDMFEAPVVDELGRLVGKITVDDVIDFMKEEAEKDYQLASGISNDIDIKDDLWSLVKARLPWLVIGVFGGVLGSLILKFNEEEMEVVPMLILFVPLIGATAGNVGVQSSAIVVQAIANGTIKGLSFKGLIKEMSLGVVSGLVLSLLILIYNLVFNTDQLFYLRASFTISLALFAVVLVSATIGTVVPLLLHKRGVDPAIATGPFITTSNDLLGIIIYFVCAKLILGI